MSDPPDTIETARDAERLINCIKSYGSVAVAFSAGVDSTVVAKASQIALGKQAVAVTGLGPALSPSELDQADKLAREIGIRHVVVNTNEIENENYKNNGPDRCFHCKSELYSHLKRVAEQLGIQTLLNGANLDDMSDYRPGLRAANDFSVHSPLVECGFDKQTVRHLARYWSLKVWDKPAAPCLASRIAYGVEVTPERLARIDAAEQWIRAKGPREVRVRLHAEERARVEVPCEWIKQFTKEPLHADMKKKLFTLGFKSVAVDPKGFRSGSLNEILPVDQIAYFQNR